MTQMRSASTEATTTKTRSWWGKGPGEVKPLVKEGTPQYSGVVLELMRRIQQVVPSRPYGSAKATKDEEVKKWIEKHTSNFGEKLLTVLAAASDSAKNEFGSKEAILGLLSNPDTAKLFHNSASDGVVDAVEEKLKSDLSAIQPSFISSFTPDFKKILESVEWERKRLDHSVAEPGHLILAMTSGKDCARDALKHFQGTNLDTHVLRQQAMLSLSGFLAEAEARSEATLSDVFQEEARIQLEPPVDLQGALAVLSNGLMERDVEAKLLLLAALSGEHLFLLGSPGTAKSLLARRLSTLCAGNFFERLLTRFSVPEELFGPLSLQALERDELRRKTEGFLPQADVAFVDEIFKANSSILNTLLMILNERYFDNGRDREQVPLWCVVSASNELPDTEELDALYDRFLLRRCVQRVSSGAVKEFITRTLNLPKPGAEVTFTPEAEKDQSAVEGGSVEGEESATDGTVPQAPAKDGGAERTTMPQLTKQTAEQLQLLANEVVLPDKILTVMAELREHCATELSLNVSDRRLVKAAQLLRVAAAAVGAREVIEADLWLLQHVFWDKNPEHSTAIKQWLEGYYQDESKSGRKSWMFMLDSIKTRLTNSANEGIDAALKRDLSGFVTACKASIVAQLRLDRGTPKLNSKGATRFFWMSEDDMSDVAIISRNAASYTNELTRLFVQAEIMLEICDINDRNRRKDLVNKLFLDEQKEETNEDNE